MPSPPTRWSEEIDVRNEPWLVRALERCERERLVGRHDRPAGTCGPGLGEPACKPAPERATRRDDRLVRAARRHLEGQLEAPRTCKLGDEMVEHRCAVLTFLAPSAASATRLPAGFSFIAA